jgi:hypothetical protein
MRPYMFFREGGRGSVTRFETSEVNPTMDKIATDQEHSNGPGLMKINK